MKSADSLVILASILAAFVFAVLVILLTTTQATGSRGDRDFVLQLLVGAFFSLVVASFLFAVLAGGAPAATRYRPFMEGYIASWILSLATVQLCVSTVWLMHEYAAGANVLGTARIVAYGAIVITALSVTGVATAPALQRAKKVSSQFASVWFGAALLAILAIPVGWLFHAVHWLTFNCDPSSCTAGPTLAAISIAAVVIMTLLTGVLESLRESTMERRYWGAPGKTGLGISMAFLGVLYAVYVANLPGL